MSFLNIALSVLLLSTAKSLLTKGLSIARSGNLRLLGACFAFGSVLLYITLVVAYYGAGIIAVQPRPFAEFVTVNVTSTTLSLCALFVFLLVSADEALRYWTEVALPAWQSVHHFYPPGKQAEADLRTRTLKSN